MYIHIDHEQECKAGSTSEKSFNVIHHINKREKTYDMSTKKKI